MKSAPSHPLQEQRCGSIILEMIGALGILMLLLSCFYASLHAVLGAGDTFVREAQAVYVLENVVERLAAESSRSPSRARTLLHEELAASDLSGEDAISASCDTGDRGTHLRIQKSGKRLLAEVCIPR